MATDVPSGSDSESFEDAETELFPSIKKKRSSVPKNLGVDIRPLPKVPSENLNYDVILTDLEKDVSQGNTEDELGRFPVYPVYPTPLDPAEAFEMDNVTSTATGPDDIILQRSDRVLEPTYESVCYPESLSTERLISEETTRLTETQHSPEQAADDIIERPAYCGGRRVSDTQFFEDRMRRIDYALAYQPGEGEREMKNSRKRSEFEARLKSQGLHLEHENLEKSQDGKTCFVKIHAPWDVLARQAEFMKLKMPISVNDVSEENLVRGCIDRCLKSFNPFELPQGLRQETEEDDYFTATFIREQAEQFIMPDRDNFFTSAERSRMVWDILIRTPYDKQVPTRIGIQRLVKNGTYTAAYPLHEGNSHMDAEKEAVYKNAKADRLTSIKNDRQLLYEAWARPVRFYKYQPLDLIRKYFGEKIGFYFAWLGYYTGALIPAALVGLICVIYGGASIPSDEPGHDVCNGTGVGNTTMCPNCDTRDCQFWKLEKSCGYALTTHVFDNIATVIFAVFMSVWGTVFLEGWKRYQAEIAWDWDVMDFEIHLETVRPEFQIRVKGERENPITKEMEPYLPFLERAFRVCTSAVTVVFFLCLVLAFVFGVIIYRVIISHILYAQNFQYASMATSATAASLNLVCILILSRVYQALAWHLTSWEFPRTDREFENSYTIKVFFFQFINFYSSLFYIAFFKGRFASLPGTEHDERNKIFGYRPEACDPAGCMVELVIQLAIIMVGKQIFSNCVEILFPILQNWWRSRQSNWETEDNIYTRWEKDFALNQTPEMCLFYEYLEMVIQYGFITLFVAAFPIAPLFALLNNIMEIRLDAYKFAVAYRRPLAAKARDIGVWFTILDGVSRFAVLTNACVIAFTSDFVPRMLYLVAIQSGSLDGFVEDSLSYYNASQLETDHTAEGFRNVTLCRYRDYRKPPCGFGLSGDCDDSYGPSVRWWHVLAARLAFVLIFEHLVFLVKGLVSYAIPDIPHHIVIKMQREEYLAKEARYKYELAKQMKTRENDGEGGNVNCKNTAWNEVVFENGGNLNVDRSDSLAPAELFHYSPKASSDSLDSDKARNKQTKL